MMPRNYVTGREMLSVMYQVVSYIVKTIFKSLAQAHWLRSTYDIDIFLQSNDFMSELFLKQHQLHAVAAGEEEVIHMGLVRDSCI